MDLNLKSWDSRAVLVQAVEAGMKVVRENQGGHLPSDAEIKDDKTLVTVTDHKSEEAILNILQANFTDIQVWGEESGVSGGIGDIVFLIDPLDGTRAFANGMATSTVIVAVYDIKKNEVIATVIGEPATGKIWSAFGKMATWHEYLGTNRVDPCRVWPGELSEQTTVFLDVSHGFTRKGRQILTDEQFARLFAKLNGQMKLAIPGSNGLIQALVANGGQKVVGSITTAIGGPWDVCGVKLVLNAGGAARAFSAIPLTTGDTGLEEKDPLDVMSYDILICGNSKRTVDDLYWILKNALYY
ncbi:MAG: inositol monophosphatase family protein [bacterium]|nr:inositol monophosphatase family protein [bacterium]